MKSTLADSKISNTNKLLILLSSVHRPMSIKELKELGVKHGLREVMKWNVSALLNASSSVILTPEGWEILDKAKNKIFDLLPTNSVTQTIIKSSSELVGKIKDPQFKGYLTEALGCLKSKFYRASVVMSWSGAVYILKKEIIKSGKLSLFNAEAAKIKKNWKNASNENEIGNLQERDLLDILEKISIIGKNLKQELIRALELRNGCGHPNSLVVEESRAIAHLDQLLINVYLPFMEEK